MPNKDCVSPYTTTNFNKCNMPMKSINVLVLDAPIIYYKYNIVGKKKNKKAQTGYPSSFMQSRSTKRHNHLCVQKALVTDLFIPGQGSIIVKPVAEHKLANLAETWRAWVGHECSELPTLANFAKSCQNFYFFLKSTCWLEFTIFGPNLQEICRMNKAEISVFFAPQMNEIQQLMQLKNTSTDRNLSSY